MLSGALFIIMGMTFFPLIGIVLGMILVAAGFAFIFGFIYPKKDSDGGKNIAEIIGYRKSK